MIRLLLLAVTLCTACGIDETYEFGAWLERAELHVDATRPGDLATTDVLLHLYGGDQGHYLRIDGVWAQPEPDGPALELDLALEDSVVFVPANAALPLGLVNTGMTNGALAVHCQSTLPMQLYVSSPGNPELSVAAFHDLTVFCP